MQQWNGTIRECAKKKIDCQLPLKANIHLIKIPSSKVVSNNDNNETCKDNFTCCASSICIRNLKHCRRKKNTGAIRLKCNIDFVLLPIHCVDLDKRNCYN